MKRMHIHIAVRDLRDSIRFYSHLFGHDPIVLKREYAKWMLDDMDLNFAITERAGTTGIDHLGIQLDSSEELAETEGRLHEAGRPMVDSEDVHCCYAQVSQAWTVDPQGVLWEAFRTTGTSELYCDGGDPVQLLRQRATSDCNCDTQTFTRTEEKLP